MSTRRQKGNAIERYACEFLRKQGLRLVARNYHCRVGEIDLIMMQGDCIVFVEVRFRRRETYGSAAESVNRSKQQRIIQCAQYFLLCNTALADHPARFDVICASPGNGATTLDWIVDAFQV